MRVEGAPYPLGAPPYLVGTSCALRTPFSYTTRILVSKKSLYNISGVLTPVSCKNLLFLFRAVFLTDLGYHDGPKRLQGQVLREGHQPLPRLGVATSSNHRVA